MPDGEIAQPNRFRSASQRRQRTKSWQIAMTPEEFGIVQQRAEGSGLSASSFGRAVLLGAPGPRARRKPLPNADLLAHAVAQLNRVGNNLNQAVLHLNAGRAVGGKEAFMALSETREAVRRILEIAGGGGRD